MPFILPNFILDLSLPIQYTCKILVCRTDTFVGKDVRPVLQELGYPCLSLCRCRRVQKRRVPFILGVQVSVVL